MKSIRVLMAVPESIEIQGMDAIRTYFQRNGVGKHASLHNVELVVL